MIRNLACAIFSFALLAGGQPAFEVASVKPSSGSDGPTMQIERGGRFTAIGITLRNLITLAYGIADEDLSGAPSWIDSARFDIVAKPAGAIEGATGDRARAEQMLRLSTLLQDRFRLAVHRRPQERRVLVLVADTGGARLPETKDGACPAASGGPGTILPMAMFAKTLAQQLGQPVIDQTGIAGSRCIRLRWTTDDGAPRSLGVRNSGLQPQTDAPPLAAAIRQQLGLKLEPRRLPIDTLVVDRVEWPAAN